MPDCPKCGHHWPDPPPADPDDDDIIAQWQKTRRFRPGSPPPKPKRPVNPLRRWGPLLVLGVLILMVLGRDRIHATWPPIGAFYEALGLPLKPLGPIPHQVAPRPEGAVIGFSVRNLTARPAVEAGRTYLRVTGEVVNNGEQWLVPPPVRIRVLDDAGKPIAEWDHALGGEALAPGKSLAFSTARADPPEAAARLEAGFVQAGK